MQQIKSTLLRHRSGKMTQNILYSWFFIFAFITRTLAFFMFTFVLFFNRIYLSLHFDEYRWETYLWMINLAMRRLFQCTRDPKLETIGQSAKSWRKPRLLFATRDIATKWTNDGSWQSFIESGGEKNETSGRRIEAIEMWWRWWWLWWRTNAIEMWRWWWWWWRENNRDVVAVMEVVEENNRNVVAVVMVVVVEEWKQ